MKLSLDRESCEAHGQCSIVDMDLFPLDDEGYSDVGPASDVPAGEEETAKLGVAACPVRALRVLQ